MESQMWSVLYEVAYEEEATIAWEGLTRTIVDRLHGHGPIIRADATKILSKQ